MTDELTVEDPDGPLVTIRLNRPERLNALTPRMLDELAAALHEGGDARAIILTGAGRGFCAGVDIVGADERQRNRTPADALRMQERFASAVLAIRRCPAPVIAAINGPAAGAGYALALASDIRLASAEASMIIGAPTIGLSAGECGISYLLPRLIGLGRATELMLTNRRIDAAEALALGVVTSVVEPHELADAARETAQAIERLSPFGVRLTKQAVQLSAEAGSLELAMALENRAQILANGTRDAAEARAAFLQKRQPVFDDR